MAPVCRSRQCNRSARPRFIPCTSLRTLNAHSDKGDAGNSPRRRCSGLLHNDICHMRQRVRHLLSWLCFPCDRLSATLSVNRDILLATLPLNSFPVSSLCCGIHSRAIFLTQLRHRSQIDSTIDCFWGCQTSAARVCPCGRVHRRLVDMETAMGFASHDK
jgi:hypothetical protein